MAEPKISGLSPSSIGASSRSTVTISGSGLDKVDYVLFGSNRVYPSGKSSSSVTVTSPALSIGQYIVQVHTSDGWSSNTKTLTVTSSVPDPLVTTPKTTTTTTQMTDAQWIEMAQLAQSNLGVTPNVPATADATPAALPTPSILNMSQTSIPAGVITQLVINGTYFGKLDGSSGYVVGAVYFYPMTGEAAGGSAATGTIRNIEFGTKVTVDTPKLSSGMYTVVVKICRFATTCASAGDYKNSSPKTLTVTAPVTPTPRVDNINPSTIEPYKSVSNIYINGANLMDVNKVTFDGIIGRVDRATDFYVIVSISPLPSKVATTVTITTSSGKSASGVIKVSETPAREIQLTVSTNINAYLYYDNVQIGTGLSKTITIKQDGNNHPVKVVSIGDPNLKKEQAYTAYKDAASSASLYLPLAVADTSPTVNKIQRVDISPMSVSAKTDTTLTLSFTFTAGGASIPASSIGQIPPYTIKFGGGTTSLFQREVSGRISGVNQVTITVTSAVAKELANGADRSKYDPKLQGYSNIAWISITDTNIYARAGISIVDLQPISTDTPDAQKFEFPESYTYPGKVPRSGGTISVPIKVKSAKSGRARIKAYGQTVKTSDVTGSNSVDTITIDISVPAATGSETKTTATVTAEEET